MFVIFFVSILSMLNQQCVIAIKADKKFLLSKTLWFLSTIEGESLIKGHCKMELSFLVFGVFILCSD